MKKILFSVIVSAYLSGCVTMPPPRYIVQRIKFPEVEYTALKNSGNSKVFGQVFAKTRGGDVKIGAGNEVYLTPITSYSNQWYKESYLQGNQMTEGDIRQQQYIRKTISDGNGKFTFNNIPEGEYFVISHVTWEVPTTSYVKRNQGGLIAQIIKVNNNDVVEVMLVR